MQKLNESHSYGTTIGALRHLHLRTAAYQEAADLRSEISSQLAASKEAYEAWQRAREVRIAATSEIAFLDEGLDNEVRALSFQLLSRFGSRDHEAYRRVFFRKCSDMTVGSGDRQERFVKAMLGVLQSDASYAEFKAQAMKIGRQLELLSQANLKRNQLFAEETQARAALVTQLVAAKRSYNRAYFELLLHFESKRLVESFFRALSTNRGAPDDKELSDDSPDATEPTQPTA